MKKILLFSFVLILAVTTVHGRAEKHTRTSSKHKILDKMRFGPQINLAVLSQDYGAFVAYHFTEVLEIRSGLLYSKDTEFCTVDKLQIITPRYVTIPLVCSIYPDRGREFYLFSGLQTSYVIGGKILDIDEGDLQGFNNEEEVLKKLREYHRKQIKSPNSEKLRENANLQRLMLSATAGLGYAFQNGFILGLEYTKGLRSLIQRDTLMHWTFQIDLGYNFAKLFKYKKA